MRVLALAFNKTLQYRVVRPFLSNLRGYSVQLQNYPKILEYFNKNKLILNNNNVQNNNTDETLLFLKQCFKTLNNATTNYEEFFKLLQEDNLQLQIDHYNYYLKICIENMQFINIQHFLDNMKVKPNKETLYLLLELTSEQGNIEEMLNILNLMKAQQIYIDDRIFNNIILGHTINGGLVGAKQATNTLKTVNFVENDDTVWFLLKGLAIQKNKSQFQDILDSKAISFNVNLFFKLLNVLCKENIENWLDLIIKALKLEVFPRENLRDLELFCSQLIKENKIESSLNIYYKLHPCMIPNNNYGIFLLKKMLQSKLPIEVIVNNAKELKNKNWNPLALEKITEFSLKEKYFEEAWIFLQHFEEKRPHYFWPLLINSKINGEIGVLNSIERMMTMNVYPDLETLQYYCLRFFDLSKPDEILIKLVNLGLTKKDVVPPLLYLLLQQEKVELAYNFFKKSKSAINDPKTYVILSQAWNKTKNSKICTLLLQEMCESSDYKNDYVGIFLINCLKKIQKGNDLNQYLNLITEIKQRNLIISNTSSDELFLLLKDMQNFKQIKELESLIEKLTDVTIRNVKTHINHPRNMNLQELECHLIELQSKQMETRGVIRKLIQQHITNKNYNKVQELRKLFLESNYEETPGMVSSLFYSYVKSGSVEESIKLYKEIKSVHKTFNIDTFKIVDFCELLVKNNKVDEALKIMDDEKKNIKSLDLKAIERNCLNVINSAENVDDLNKLYKALTEYKYCIINNVSLGPIIRMHIKKGDIEMAVNKYQSFAKEYKCTPLQFELLLEVLKEKNQNLLDLVLKTTEQVHGAKSTLNALFGALAESKMENQLKKLFFTENGISAHLLKKRIERWILERKIEPLQTILNVLQQISKQPISIDLVCSSILKVYSLKNDAKGAEEFWQDLEEKEIIISRELQDEYRKLLDRCKYKNVK